jgi:hypothetical protein
MADNKIYLEKEDNGLFEDVWDLNGDSDKKIIKDQDKESIKEWDDVLNVYEEHRSQQSQKKINTEINIPDSKTNKPNKPKKSKLKQKIKQHFNDKHSKKNDKYDDEYDDTYDAYYE